MPKKTTKIAPGPKSPSSSKGYGVSETKETPAWPALMPLVPAIDLHLETMLEDQIIVIRKFFTKALCQKYVAFLSKLPLTTTPGIPKKGHALRVNDRYQIQDPMFAELLYRSTALQSLVTDAEQDWGGKVIGLNPNIRIYRYVPGQFFDQHYDESNQIILPGDPNLPAKTTWTLLLYLTDSSQGCQGGETVFYPEYGQVKGWKAQSTGVPPISVAPELGMVLLHKHGDDCLLHEGKEVTAGEKWVIRSDLCVAR